MIADDFSNGSIITSFIAAALIGGILMTIHTLRQLRRLDRDASLAGSVVCGPWVGSTDQPDQRSWTTS